MTHYLDNINGPADLKTLDRSQLPALADEIRQALITKVGATGGHMGPNLGVVEATIAMHYVFDSPKDKFIWDVSHQSYTHKILTGRKQAFLDPAHYHDLSGYTSPQESEHDHFVVGHTGTSISMAVGMAKGRDLCGRTENVIAFIGDGSLSEGEALEGLDNAGEMTTNLIIIVNDNEMSIAPNHGGIYKGLAELRATNGASEHNLFRDFGLDYRYVADGNDVNALIDALAEVKDIDHPVVVHIHTDKGHGLERVNATREAKESGHWMLPQSVQDAMVEAGPVEDYASVSRDYLLNKMKRDRRVVVLSAGTPGNGGFDSSAAIRKPIRIASWTSASPNSMRWRRSPASPRRAASPCMRWRPRSCSVPMTSCSRIWRCKAPRRPSSRQGSATPSGRATTRIPTSSTSP